MNALWSMDQECCKGYMTYIQAKRSAYTYSIMSKETIDFVCIVISSKESIGWFFSVGVQE